MSELIVMKKRIQTAGGDTDGRNIKGKYKSFQAALKDSYQAEWIHLDTEEAPKWRCLINPEKLTTEYDQKIISIDFKAGLKPGDTFYWDRTNKHWLVYTQFEEEEAYFRARLRECDYTVDVNGTSYWVYVRGPVETAEVWNQKHDIEFNDLNYSIELYVTSNEDTLAYFTRNQIIKFEGHNWKVAATDKYSQQGVIEVFLEETYDNIMEDAMVTPVVEEHEENDPNIYIDGPQLVSVYDTNLTYTIKNYNLSGEFVISSKKVKIVNQDKESCIIDIITGKAGSFTIIYKMLDGTEISLPVTIQSF